MPMQKSDIGISPRTRLQLLGLQDTLVRRHLDMHRLHGRDYVEALECLALELAAARRCLARTVIQGLARRNGNPRRGAIPPV